jgi:prephenate dehydrogenase
MFRRVVIIGVGLMGGSLGKAIKKHNLAREVIGVSNQQEVLDKAREAGAIDTGLTDAQKAVLGADLIVLAVPVQGIIKILAALGPSIRRGCIVTDIGSAKAEIVEKAEASLSLPGFFVGSHPLTGSEKSGIEHASAELFENALCLMTPTDKTNQVAKEKIKHLWTKIGARVEFVSVAEHDKALAYVSHLPHVLAYGLMRTVPQEALKYASQGLKDATRLAASSPQMWNDICMANSKNILNALDEMVKYLAVFRKAIINNDSKELIQHFSKAKENREILG